MIGTKMGFQRSFKRASIVVSIGDPTSDHPADSLEQMLIASALCREEASHELLKRRSACCDIAGVEEQREHNQTTYQKPISFIKIL